MRYFLILLVFSSCSAGWHARQAVKHLNKAIEKGADVDTIRQVKRDTVRSVEVRDSIRYVPVVDTSALAKLCGELLRVDTVKVKVPDKSESMPAKRLIVQRIQKKVCPQIDLDSTYSIPFQWMGKDYHLPVRVRIHGDGSGVDYNFDAGNVDIPIVTSETNLQVKARPTWWDVVIFAGFTGFLCFIVGRVTRR
jgi:hypothetical protein